MVGEGGQYLGMKVSDVLMKAEPILSKPQAKHDLALEWGEDEVTREMIDKTIELGLEFPAGLVYVIHTLRVEKKRRDAADSFFNSYDM